MGIAIFAVLLATMLTCIGNAFTGGSNMNWWLALLFGGSSLLTYCLMKRSQNFHGAREVSPGLVLDTDDDTQYVMGRDLKES